MRNKVSDILQLTRIGLSTAIGFSAVAGQLLYAREASRTTLFTFLGVLLLSGAASGFNQYQERELDSKMGRTRNRPLPSGRLRPKDALIMASSLFIIATLLLSFTTTIITVILGVFNLLWYNLVYTPLKRRSAFALPVGSLTGAIPPIIGWSASGGHIFNPMIIAVAVFMFIWQIPHFWLILLKYGREYEAAGFEKLSTLTFGKNIKLILFIWVLGTSLSTACFPYLHIIDNPYLIASLIVINIVLIYYFYRFLFNPEHSSHIKSAFGTIYLYQVFVLTMLIISAIIF